MGARAVLAIGYTVLQAEARALRFPAGEVRVGLEGKTALALPAIWFTTLIPTNTRLAA